MTLYFKRAKCFVQSDDNGTRKFLAQPGPSPQPVPFWVASTATFERGVKDGSIVNLTPPAQMPGYVHPKADDVADEPADVVGPQDPAGEEVEQKEVPQAPFGGQPMTPVAPAPKVGSVRAAGGRGGNK
jgi:hypothetical protein